MTSTDTYRAYQRLLWAAERRPLTTEEIAKALYEAEFGYGPPWELLEARYRTSFTHRAEATRKWLSNPRSFRARRLRRRIRRHLHHRGFSRVQRELRRRFWGTG